MFADFPVQVADQRLAHTGGHSTVAAGPDPRGRGRPVGLSGGRFCLILACVA